MARISPIVVPGSPHQETPRGVRSREGFHHTGVSAIDPRGKDRTLRGWITNGKEFLRSGDDKATGRLRLETRTGRPAGGEELIAIVEGLTGRDLRRGPAGRPRHKNRFMFPDSPLDEIQFFTPDK